MKKELLEKIEKLHELEKYQEIIDTIEALPAEQLNTELIGQLARAYNNVENYAKGLELLKTIEFEEGHSLIWNWRAGYSYFFLDFFSKILLRSATSSLYDLSMFSGVPSSDWA